MTEVGIIRNSPDSDCNSNHHGSASYVSNTSSQDIDFIQDNSDYQWFIDYGYRDGTANNHTSILSLPESYEASDLNYYDVFSKNIDANLAEADMESFRTEDIHALLTNLPPMCTDHLSQENNRQGENYASITGSLMAKFNLVNSVSPHNSSQGDEYSTNSNSMSICKSELLFSPVKETLLPVNFSVDSLDSDFHDMMLTCQANKDNYTIAFEGSVTTYSEDGDCSEKDKISHSRNSDSLHWANNMNYPKKNLGFLDNSMTRSDSSTFTTWSKLKKSTSNNLKRHPSGNNNNSENDSGNIGITQNAVKSQSMPNLFKRKDKLRNLTASVLQKNTIVNPNESSKLKRRPVKVFDIQHQTNSSDSGSVSEMATSVDLSFSDNINTKPNFSLVKLFMKQKSISVEGMSTTMDQLSSSENWPASQSEESSSGSKENVNLKTCIDSKTSDFIKTYDSISEEPEDDLPRYATGSQSIKNTANSEKVIPKNFNNNNSFNTEKTAKLNLTNILMNRSIQTSQFSEITNLKNANKTCLEASKKSVKILEPSFLRKLKLEGEGEKPVYVLYPNYVLPNLDFLNEQNETAQVLLLPQKAPKVVFNKRRPFSCNDLESLKKKGFGHVKDWDSLNFLLPQEYRNILSEVPEISEHIKIPIGEKPSFLHKQFVKKRPSSCEINQSSSSSINTQPSSGYRGSSSLLTDSQNSPVPNANLNPLFVYRYDSVTSSDASLLTSEKHHRSRTALGHQFSTKCGNLQQDECLASTPPLPKGILRKGFEKGDSCKRYSMYETSEEENIDDPGYKRKSLPDAYYIHRFKRFSETEDEGVDAGTSSSSLDENPECLSNQNTNFILSNTSELAQFEEFLKLSGISSSDNEDLSEKNLGQLKSYVSKFLALKMNQEGGENVHGRKCVSFAEHLHKVPKQLETKQFFTPNNSPNISAFAQQKTYQTKKLSDMPISEENESSPSHFSRQTTPVHLSKNLSDNLIQKRSLIVSVTDSVEQVIHHFSLASNQVELNMLGDSNLNPVCSKLLLSTLCPALYAVLSDGLKPSIETSFGAIHNSVWQVVEASAQQGPLTKALNELVMRINSEDAITEGLVKFNAFVFGLLNVRSLDAWTSFLRTRESVLKKHYTADSLMLMSHTGSSSIRSLLDTMISALQPLAFLPFQLDLLFEFKELHQSFKRMDSYHQPFSPTHKHSPSPNFKQFNSGKLAQSNNSNSESEEISTANTVKQYSTAESTLPDLLSSSTFKSHMRNGGRERPRSCIDSNSSHPNFKLGDDVHDLSRKRWSGIALTSKLYQAYHRLTKDDEEYVDSLENNTNQDKSDDSNSNENVLSLVDDREPESLDSNFSDDKPINGRRFKKLQKKWEMLSAQNSTESSPPPSPTHSTKSKIPRPITSPIKPSGIPIPVVTTKTTKKITSLPNTKTSTPVKSLTNVKNSPAKRCGPNTRASRMDQLVHPNDITRHPQRPSSLPYKPSTQNGKNSKSTSPRRAASSSLSRRPLSTSKTPKVVRTISRRLPSESGHLEYNDGDRLRVVLEVDEKWLLCCKGTQKGLVPRSAVIADTGRF